ncbi:uncharacterized protein TNCV_4056841 [Trichonephila clavipes]|nr:uncharacterized protein TNCV_4056841 [Trichonephila clavipes]
MVIMWIRLLNDDGTDVHDGALSRRPSVVNDSLVEKVNEKIRENIDGSKIALKVAAVAEWYRYRIVACLVTSSNPVPLKTRHVGQRCTLNLSRAETSSRWCGVVVREGVPAQASSTSLDHGSKLRGPSPNAVV